MRHTFFSCLIRCANMKWIRWVLLKIQSGHDFVHRGTDGRTDRRTDGQGDTSIPPFQLRWSGGYKYTKWNMKIKLVNPYSDGDTIYSTLVYWQTTHLIRIWYIYIIKHINTLGPNDVYRPRQPRTSFVQIMAVQRQAIIWTNAGILSIGPLATNFHEISIKIYTFSFKKMHLKLSAKWQPFCFSLNVLIA